MRKVVSGVCVVLFACAARADWVSVAQEYFEGAFPQASWQLLDNDGAVNGEYYWVNTNNRFCEGNWSGWCAGGGADGISLTPGSDEYPANCNSWLITPAVDLSDTTNAYADLYYWLDSESGLDFLKVLVSLDDSTYWEAWSVSGYTGGWMNEQVYLTNVPGLGDVTGYSSVWVAIVFTSNSSNSVWCEGAYIDYFDVFKYRDAPDDDDDQFWISCGGAPGASGPGAPLAVVLLVAGAAFLRRRSAPKAA